MDYLKKNERKKTLYCKRQRRKQPSNDRLVKTCRRRVKASRKQDVLTLPKRDKELSKNIKVGGRGNKTKEKGPFIQKERDETKDDSKSQNPEHLSEICI